MMKRLFCLLFSTLLAAVSGLVAAEPSSNVAWTPETLNLVASGQASRGQELGTTCTACHGADGISSIDQYPNIAGQLAAYAFKQLQDFKDGNRVNLVMAPFVTPLDDRAMADLAAWAAALSAAVPALDPSGAPELVRRGDSTRMIPACEACHGRDGLGQAVDVPSLKGQKAAYLELTLKAYRDGSRGNDLYSRMRSVAAVLSDDEITEIAKYYSGE